MAQSTIGSGPIVFQMIVDQVESALQQPPGGNPVPAQAVELVIDPAVQGSNLLVPPNASVVVQIAGLKLSTLFPGQRFTLTLAALDPGLC